MGGHGSRLVAGVSVTLALLAGCGSLEDLDSGKTGTGQSDTKGGKNDAGDKGDARGTNPLDNPEGTKPGLAPISSGKDMDDARALIDKVPTKGRGPKTGYDRDEFGYAWADNADGIPLAHNGCDTRNDLLKRDGEDIEYRSGSKCVIVSMTLYDPYTGKTIDWTKQDASAVQIDHVMPLSYDWQMGASRWSDAERKRIANDPLNLLPVDGSTNSSKGDSGPATWLPPRKGIRCSYAVRFAQVALKYDLPVTTADKAAMADQCR
ncbi:HNH endonuclease family protein [Microbispora sp. NPDC049125]|uniref:HNH endonuclease family protein n=1 Tax=Microbispora sp. NPDC049125 TaxID=3154929 RepID=UPI0034671F40